jgi:RND family efflux transporter MFP subunit
MKLKPLWPLLISLAFISCNKQDDSKIISLEGHFIPAQSVEIKPLVEGILSEIHFLDGAHVEKGELLFTIDKAPYEEKLEAAHLKKLVILKKMQIAAENADRYRSLLLHSYIQESDYRQSLLELTLHETALVESDAEIRFLQLQVNNCRIVAPFTGVIGKHYIDKGSLIHKEPLALLNEVDPLYVDFFVDESFFASLNNLLKTESNPTILINDSVRASLLFLDNTISNNKVLLRAQIENKEGKFCPGQKAFGKVTLPR